MTWTGHSCAAASTSAAACLKLTAAIGRAGIAPIAVAAVALAFARPAEAQGPGPTSVGVSGVVQRDIPATVRLVGTVLPDRIAIVAAEVAGPIAELEVEEGQFVRRGDVICRIDPTTAQLLRDAALATLEAWKERLAELENGTRPEELRRLRAARAEAQALYEKAEYEKQRVDGLYRGNLSNDKEKMDADAEFRAASERLAQAKASLEAAENGPRREVLAQMRSDVQAQGAVSRRLERDVRKTDIRAPFDGFVTAKRTEVGEWIVEGGPVVQMVAIETVRVRTHVPESAVGVAAVGQPATLEIESLGRTLAGTIARVIPLAEAGARTFPIEIDVTNADHGLLPGMFVWVHVPAGPAGAKLMVNKDAIVSRGTAKTIYVIRPGEGGASMALPLPATTGLELGGEIEVQAPGLAAGDQVVVRANERLYGPTPVLPQPAGPAASQPAAAATRPAAAATRPEGTHAP